MGAGDKDSQILYRFRGESTCFCDGSGVEGEKKGIKSNYQSLFFFRLGML